MGGLGGVGGMREDNWGGMEGALSFQLVYTFGWDGLLDFERFIMGEGGHVFQLYKFYFFCFWVGVTIVFKRTSRADTLSNDVTCKRFIR